MIDRSERPCGDGWTGRWRCHRPTCARCTVSAMRREAIRAIREAEGMPPGVRFVPWSVVAETADRPRDLPGAVARARTALRNRVAWARRDRRWWRTTTVRAWMGAAVLDGDQVVGIGREIATIEDLAGGDAIGIVLHGVIASRSPLVDEGAVRHMLARGRAWKRILGQIEVGKGVDQTKIDAVIVDQISMAWGRSYDDPEITAALSSRGRGGWESLRVRISPQAEKNLI